MNCHSLGPGWSLYPAEFGEDTNISVQNVPKTSEMDREMSGFDRQESDICDEPQCRVAHQPVLPQMQTVFANAVSCKKMAICHHAPTRTDKQLEKLAQKHENNIVKLIKEGTKFKFNFD